MKKSIVIEIIALLYVCLMLYTGLSKLMDYEITREQMSVMPLVGPVAGIITWFLPVFEIILAVVLFIEKTRIPALYIATGLMLVFTLYVAYMMKFYSHLPCTCGGFLQSLSWPQHLAFNIGFVLLGVLAIFLSKKKESTIKRENLTYSNY